MTARNGGFYELLLASLVPRDQLWFYHPDMERRIAQAEADFRAGRVTSTVDPEAAQSFLDGLKRG